MVLTPRRVPLATLAAAAGGALATSPAAVVGQAAAGDAPTSTATQAPPPPPAPAGEVEVTGVVLDTRRVQPGVLFCCVPGARADGHDFAAAAVAGGAAALCVERPLPLPVPQLLVPRVRTVLPVLGATFYGHPSRRLDLVGVTGTSGKTTTTYLLEAIAEQAGQVPGVIGTVETRIGPRRLPAAHTTPEAPDLQALLYEMAEAGVGLAAMEVSSHGLAIGRVAQTRFAAAVFTNLSQDHLDFHTDMEDYFQAKATLFTPDYTPVAVVNTDDPYGRRLAGAAPVRVVTTGTGEGADWRATGILTDHSGVAFTLDCPLGTRPVRLHLAGAFSVANALGALAAAAQTGIDLDTAVAGVAALPGVPGRLERVDAGQPFTVLVDYAHKPAALDNALRACRALTAGRVLVVFGCGGDRDRAKRPIMGETAARLADLTVITSDNPRSEDPGAIIAAIAQGARRAAPAERLLVEPDRRAAIAAALARARPGDLVLIAGKGHEQGQEFAGGHKIPFDDRTVTREELARLPTATATGAATGEVGA